MRPDRLGDVILSTALPREIKKCFPNSFVVMLVRNYAKEILSNNPFIDEIISIDDENGAGFSAWDLVKEIRKRDFTHSFSLLPTERVNWILFFAGVRMRIGVGNKFYQFITNTKSVYRRGLKPLRHEADYCADFLRKLNIEVSSYDSEIFIDKASRELYRNLKKELLGGKRYLVAVHSTYGGSTPNWKPDYYKSLIDKLLSTNEVAIVLTDFQIPEELKNIAGVNYPDVSTQKKLIGLISACDLLVSSSTGPSHVAGAVGTRTLTLFCPLPACSPTLWRPTGNLASVIHPEFSYCSLFCNNEPKNCHFEGENGITVENVFAKVKQIFAEIS